MMTPPRRWPGWRLVTRAPGVNLQMTVGDDDLAGLESRSDDRLVTFGSGDRDRAHFDLGVAIDDEHVRARLPGLHGQRRHHDGVRIGAEEQRRVHELSGPEAVADVVERRFQLDRARGRVDGIVDERQAAVHRGRRPSAPGSGGPDAERPGPLEPPDAVEELARHRERHVDRRQLVHHDERCLPAVRGLDQIAFVRLQRARCVRPRAPGYGCTGDSTRLPPPRRGRRRSSLSGPRRWPLVSRTAHAG